MRRPIGNTVHWDDYTEINEGVDAIKRATSFLQSRGITIEIPHQHRYWEYGTAVQILLRHFQERLPDIEVLDVGAGWGAVGPTLSMFYNVQVTEAEPLEHCRASRKKCNQMLKTLNKKEIIITDHDLFKLPDKKYDVVLCVSVLEHVTKEHEPAAWAALADKVKPGGVLYITCDCMTEPEKPHQCDDQRATNYTLDDLKFRIGYLTNLGFTTMGQPDYNYNGNLVFDYSFFRVGLVKTGE